ncbi:trypsin-like peptidase domain-containing protein [Luteibaculum oceani]|uniref:PDZ domain-containing protein n=1 Tax=Luteibaculum oceani TaxID=1294296 RepID=A0A5C6VA89_9FLAO|nr:trypsin-like peptidase domain-containing protein [Luteibaculum oceani]TXC81381.1 PDZ domain-containing protein [Luteibaculum oceani]
MKKGIYNIFFGLVGGFIGFGIMYLVFTQEAKQELNPAQTKPAQFVNMPIIPTNEGEQINFEFAAEKAVNAVVHVWTERIGQRRQDPWSYFFGYPSQPRVAMSSGSGVIVSSDGFIVTNNHVIDGANNIRVNLNNGESKEAKLIGKDPSTDLALLKIEGENYPYLPYGNSDQIKVGQWVLAVGNPFNLSSTVTAGIISAKARNINLLEQDATRQFPLESFIQTDAAVNPGNSGGALVGVNGELLGINTAIASNTGSYAGYAFAVPVNLVKKVVSDLYEFGAVQRAFIGVSIRDIDAKLVEDLDLDNYEGVYVAGLADNGAAEEGGIKPNDIILAVNEVKVKNVTELQEQIGKYRPGDKVDIELLRNDKKLKRKITLRNINGSTELNAAPVKSEVSSVMGAQLRSASPDELNKLRLPFGVIVEGIDGSLLRRSGIKEGFVITKIDREPVKTPEEVKLLLEKKKSGVLIEGFYPNGTKAYYGFGI